MKKREVLAPVGNQEMLYAAIAGGADAVYLAGPSFGARAYADNFGLKEIKEAVKLCHFFNVSVYVTVNTLIKESEINEVFGYINDLYDSDVDAVIVQDLGLAKLIHENYPDFELHASTQISANSIYAVKHLEHLGFSRVVLARELSIKEIREIKENTNTELEVFVHGSLCVSYSGKCLMSSMIGGRSGNRGRCAQPCRKKYDLLNPDGDVIIEDSFLLSPLDLGLRYKAKELFDIGVDSVKIEGRLKKPEYVYTASSFYSAINNGQKSDSTSLNEVSNRGFTMGAAYNEFGNSFVDINDNINRGTSVGTIIKRNVKGIALSKDISYRDSIEIELNAKKYSITADNDYKAGEFYALENFSDAVIGSSAMKISSSKLRDLNYLEILKNKKKKIAMKLDCIVGKPAQLTLSSEGVTVAVNSDEIVDYGKNLIVDYEYAKKQLSKLGDTWFELENLEVNTDNKSFLSSGQLNALRRLGVDSLYNSYTKKYNRESTSQLPKCSSKTRKPTKPTISIAVAKLTKDIVESPLFKSVDRLYLQNLNDLSMTESLDVKIYYEMPQMLNQKKLEKTAETLETLKYKLDGIVVNNSWEADIISGTDYKIIYGNGLNIYNSETINELSTESSELFVISPELNLSEIKDVLNKSDKAISCTVFANLDEMLLYHCPASPLGCNRNCSKCKYNNGYSLRINNDIYSFYRQGEVTRIKNTIPISGIEHIPRLIDMGIDDLYLELDSDNFELIINIVDKLINGEKLTDEMKKSFAYTKPGHFERGVL